MRSDMNHTVLPADYTMPAFTPQRERCMCVFVCVQGLWRIPSQDVDRAGSFAAHLSQALLLLLSVLKATHDAKMLFFVHRQMATSPPNDRPVTASWLVCCPSLCKHLSGKLGKPREIGVLGIRRRRKKELHLRKLLRSVAG